MRQSSLRLIVVVQREAIARGRVAGLLRQQGLLVLAVASPQDGLRILRSNAVAIDALVVDTTGESPAGVAEFVREAQDSWPSLHILVAASPAAQQSMPVAGAGRLRVLPLPADPERIVAALLAMLAEIDPPEGFTFRRPRLPQTAAPAQAEATPPPLSPRPDRVLALGQALAGVGEYGRSVRRDAAADPSARRRSAAMGERADALRTLIAATPASTLADATVQMGVAHQLAATLIDPGQDVFDDAEKLRATHAALRRILQSVMPVVAAIAGLEPSRMGWDEPQEDAPPSGDP